MTKQSSWHILENDAPGISKRLRELSPGSRQILAVRAAIMAATAMPELGTQEEAVLELLKTHGGLSTEQAKSAIAAADTADEKYLELQQQGRERPEWIGYFCRARLLQGIATAFQAFGSYDDDIVDAIYEMRFCVQSPSQFLRHVDSEIRLLKLSEVPETGSSH